MLQSELSTSVVQDSQWQWWAQGLNPCCVLEPGYCGHYLLLLFNDICVIASANPWLSRLHGLITEANIRSTTYNRYNMPPIMSHGLLKGCVAYHCLVSRELLVFRAQRL